MNLHQKFTPKYWVGHSTISEDVFFETASKTRFDTYDKMKLKFGEEWEEGDELSVDVIELCLIGK